MSRRDEKAWGGLRKKTEPTQYELDVRIQIRNANRVAKLGHYTLARNLQDIALEYTKVHKKSLEKNTITALYRNYVDSFKDQCFKTTKIFETRNQFSECFNFYNDLTSTMCSGVNYRADTNSDVIPYRPIDFQVLEGVIDIAKLSEDTLGKATENMYVHLLASSNGKVTDSDYFHTISLVKSFEEIPHKLSALDIGTKSKICYKNLENLFFQILTLSSGKDNFDSALAMKNAHSFSEMFNVNERAALLKASEKFDKEWE